MQTLETLLLVNWLADEINSDKMVVPCSYLQRGVWSAIIDGMIFDIGFTDTRMTITINEKETERYVYHLNGETLSAETQMGNITIQVCRIDNRADNLSIDGHLFHLNG